MRFLKKALAHCSCKAVISLDVVETNEFARVFAFFGLGSPWAWELEDADGGVGDGVGGGVEGEDDSPCTRIEKKIRLSFCKV